MSLMDEAPVRPSHDGSSSESAESLLIDDGTRRDGSCVTRAGLALTPDESNLDIPPGITHEESTEDDAFIEEAPEDEIIGPGSHDNHETSSNAKQEDDSTKTLKRHTLSLWLAFAFTIASIFIWAITCTLSYKPIQFETYYDTVGQYSSVQYAKNDRWRRVSRVGLQVLGTLSIPLTSTVCASAAVVYCQRSSIKRQPTMSMRQTLVLADKGWLDLNTWVNLCGPMGRRTYSPLLILSMLLCGLAFSISVLQGAFIETISRTVMTSADTNFESLERTNPQLFRNPQYTLDTPRYSVIGSTISMLNNGSLSSWGVSYLTDIIEATIAGKAEDVQPNLWPIGTESSNQTSLSSFYPTDISTEQTHFEARPFFTSVLAVSTDTGVLKALALRIGVTLQCRDISHSEFLANCTTTASLAMNFTNAQYQGLAGKSIFGGSYLAPIFSFRLCSPELKNWTRDNDSSNSIHEDLFMDLQTSASFKGLLGEEDGNIDTITSNFTYHCSADSNLAYFEPMNEWNGHKVQNMVDLNAKDRQYFTGPNIASNTQTLIYLPGARGPLTNSILALFGNNTFFDSIAKANDTEGANLDVCCALRMPLTGLCVTQGGVPSMCSPFKIPTSPLLGCIYPLDFGVTTSEHDCSSNYPNPNSNKTATSGTLAYFLYLWLQKFGNRNSTMAAFTFTNFFSAKAMLDPNQMPENLDLGEGNQVPDDFPRALQIYTSPGLQIQKVHIPFAAIVLISVLLLLQIAGLLALGVYSSARHTWTASLDGFALLRMGKAMGDSLPLISAADKKNAEVLDETGGWIGDEGEDEGMEGGVRLLKIGGSGRVRSKTPYRTKRDLKAD